MHSIGAQHSSRRREPGARTSGARNDGERKTWGLLVLLCVAQFMVLLDATIVNVALPSIGRELGFAARDLQWVVTAYVLMTGGLLMLGGRLADLLGRRRVFLTGLIVFSGASLASGLAPSAGALIAARAAQGLGAAMLSPSALSIITSGYFGERRTRALSAWGAIGGAGAAAGMLLGGVLTTWLSWEWVFLVNVPVGLITALLALRVVPATRTAEGSLREIDLPGAVTVVSGLTALVFAVEGSSTHGWGSARTLGLFVLSFALLTGFAAIEARARRPLIPVRTWRVRSLVSSSTVMLVATGVLVGTFFLNSLFLQDTLRASALQTGLAFLPGCLVTGAAAFLGPRLLMRFGARAIVVVGLALVAGADLLLSGAPADASYLPDLLPGLLVLGLGMGLVFVTVSVTAMSEVREEDAGLASGMLTTGHEIGGALGIAVFTVIALGSGGVGGAAFVNGYGEGLVAGAAIAVALALTALAAIPAFRPSSVAHAAMH
jgi:EmrB/QacA subfamily drug resistance transporter